MAVKRNKTTTTGKTNGAHPSDRPMIPVINPVTNATIGEIPINTPEEVRATVERVRFGQRLWGARTPENRATLIAKFRDLLWENREEIIAIIRAETGKSRTSAFLDMIGTDSTATYVAHNLARVLKPQHRAPLFPIFQSGKLYYRPYGVVGYITPWNYPLHLVFSDVIPGLAAGNTVVIKPSEIAPFTTFRTVELMYEAGIPEDAVQIVTGEAETGQALVDVVDYISFTGSTEVGRKIAVRAAERLIPADLELGGKNAMIVAKDADLDLAATMLVLSMGENAGQMCVSIERVYVEAPIYDQFLYKVKQVAGEVILGNGDDDSVHVGSLTTHRELQRVQSHVQDALDKGAKLLSGGKHRPDIGPYFYEPAVVIDVNHEMKIMCEETFACAVGIMPVDDLEEAVRLVNASNYGMTSAVFTDDLQKGEHIAQMLHTGDTTINTASINAITAALPWGGGKESGLTKRGGDEGILRFVQTKSIIMDRGIFKLDELEKLSIFLNGLRVIREVRKYLPFV